MFRTIALLTSVFTGAVCLAGTIGAGSSFAETTSRTTQVDVLRLERLVRQDCGSCHGLTRKGGLGSDLRREALAHWERDDLVNVILDGIPGTAMPPWRPIMSEAEAEWIANYLLTKE